MSYSGNSDYLVSISSGIHKNNNSSSQIVPNLISELFPDKKKNDIEKACSEQLFHIIKNEKIDESKIEIINAILRNQPNLINIIDAEGKTLLIHSIINSNKPFTHYLLKNGIDTYHVDKTKKNALFYAIDQKYENLDIITSLISSENINFEGPDKITPLILAVKRKHNKTVELLLEKNAFVDCYVESTGDTPLHIAVRDKNSVIIKLLLQKSAKISLLNSFNQSSYDLADENIKNLIMEESVKQGKTNSTPFSRKISVASNNTNSSNSTHNSNRFQDDDLNIYNQFNSNLNSKQNQINNFPFLTPNMNYNSNFNFVENNQINSENLKHNQNFFPNQNQGTPISSFNTHQNPMSNQMNYKNRKSNPNNNHNNMRKYDNNMYNSNQRHIPFQNPQNIYNNVNNIQQSNFQPQNFIPTPNYTTNINLSNMMGAPLNMTDNNSNLQMNPSFNNITINNIFTPSNQINLGFNSQGPAFFNLGLNIITNSDIYPIQNNQNNDFSFQNQQNSYNNTFAMKQEDDLKKKKGNYNKNHIINKKHGEKYGSKLLEEKRLKNEELTNKVINLKKELEKKKYVNEESKMNRQTEILELEFKKLFIQKKSISNHPDRIFLNSEEVYMQLGKEIQRFVLDVEEYNKKTRTLFESLIERTISVIKNIFPNSIVSVYGSFATELSLPYSDIDMVIQIDSVSFSLNNDYLSIIEDDLKKKDWIKEIKNIRGANIPVLKVLCGEEYNNKRLDISIKEVKHNGLMCVALIKDLIKNNEFLKSLTLVLKHFMYCLNFSDTYSGGLSSYGLILMIFSFLQEKQNFVNNENKVKCFGILLIEFFKYYSEFNFSTTIIEPKLNVLETNAINFHPFGGSLYIIDPLNKQNNVGRSTYNINSIKKSFLFSLFILHENFRLEEKGEKLLNLNKDLSSSSENSNEKIDIKIDIKSLDQFTPSYLLKRLFQIPIQWINKPDFQIKNPIVLKKSD